ncbi:protein kinase [Trypanosoma rangeli SC58]|uniref:Protein kinase n=1 Tax=Trypanosoma rangeli SC58 TaxID=429131 RepID=A0A061J0R6_TRYRA|nr:protein kinase [Trypanosoma rangeli SC58]
MRGGDSSPASIPPPPPFPSSSSSSLFRNTRHHLVLRDAVGDSGHEGDEDGSGAGSCVCLLEPTPPPAGGGVLEAVQLEPPPSPLQAQQSQQQQQLSADEKRAASDANATSFGRTHDNLRGAEPKPPLAATPAVACDTHAGYGTGARRTLRLSRRPSAVAATEEQGKRRETLPLTTGGEATVQAGNSLIPVLPRQPDVARAMVGSSSEVREEALRAGGVFQPPPLVGPPTTGPTSLTGEEAPPTAKRQRNSTDWGELMSPTPTPQGMYSCGCSPSIRRHSRTGVPLPSGPTPIDFSSVTDFVETKYEVKAKISEGTYGEVYVGRCLATGETVALKRLKVLHGLDGFPITSLREVIALRHINNARENAVTSEADSGTKKDPIGEVISLRDVLLSRASHDIYLVFPYASCSIAGLLQRRFSFTEREIAYVFTKLLRALTKLHAMGIIHRDVKADNVLMNYDGQVRLGDFGLCAFEGSGRRALTPSLINLSYRPPEMLLGSTSYDVKVDIWSVGCFLAQMYLRTPPFFLANRRHTSDGGPARGGHAGGRQQQPHDNYQHRRAEMELEQLSLITDVLGPLSSASPDAFPQELCQRSAQLEQLRKALATTSASSLSSSTPSLGSLFQPSFLYMEFHGFAAWFLATAEHRRRDASHLLPSKECVDVLTAIFQLDPRKRPTAAQLLEMPFFDLHRSAPRRVAAHGGLSKERLSEDELIERHIQREIAEKLLRYHDSHIAPTTERGK